MDRKTTPEIEEAEEVMELGRQAFRDGHPFCPYPRGSRKYGYWRLGFTQERDKGDERK